MHGWGCDHTSLMPFIDKLKEKFTCVCFDFFGFGKSQKVTKPLCVDDYKDAVIKTLQKLGFLKISIVAHSVGARVAFKIASESDVEVNKMFLVGPAGIKPRFSFKTFFKSTNFNIFLEISSCRCIKILLYCLILSTLLSFTTRNHIT